MAIYHASIGTISRSAGHTATAAAAYRAGLAITDERTGEKHDYTRRGGVVETAMFAPALAPAWAKDPAALWNAAEAAENRKNSVVAREFEISLPHELNPEQRRLLVDDLGQSLVDRYGFAIQASTHEPHDGKGDDRNHHVHLLATTRRIGPEGLTEKTRELDGGKQGHEEIRAVRALIADRINHHLTLAGVGVRVDHRSLAAQSAAAEVAGDFAKAAGLTREPTQHEGKTTTAAKRAGHVLDRAQKNIDIRQDNSMAMNDYLRQVRAEGRLHPSPSGQREQAAAEVTQRQSPSGPLVAVGVQGYTRQVDGKPVQVAGHIRKQHAAAAPARPTPRAVVPSRRGGSHVPASTGGAGGGALVHVSSGGKSKEARAEDARASAEHAQHKKNMAWQEKMLAKYLLDLDRMGRQCSQTMEDAMRAMLAAPIKEGQAQEFRFWLTDRGRACDKLDALRADKSGRLNAHEEAQAKHQRRQKRLARFVDENPEPGRLQWKSKRAWSELREKLAHGLERADKQQRQSRVLVSAAELAALDARADEVAAQIRMLDEDRPKRWPLPGEEPQRQPEAKPTPSPTVPTPTQAPTQTPRTLGQAAGTAATDEEEQRRRSRAGLASTLRPRPRPPQ